MGTSGGTPLLVAECVCDQAPLSASWVCPLGCLLCQTFLMWRRNPEAISLLHLKNFGSIPAPTARQGAEGCTWPSAESCRQVNSNPWLCGYADVATVTVVSLSLRYSFQAGYFKGNPTVSLQSHPMVMKHNAEWYSKSIIWSLWSMGNLLVTIHRCNLKIQFCRVRPKRFCQLWPDRWRKCVTAKNEHICILVAPRMVLQPWEDRWFLLHFSYYNKTHLMEYYTGKQTMTQGQNLFILLFMTLRTNSSSYRIPKELPEWTFHTQ